MKAKQIQHRPTIETVINMAAMSLTAFGVAQVTINANPNGYVAIVVAVGLEFFKYWGRKRTYW